MSNEADHLVVRLDEAEAQAAKTALSAVAFQLQHRANQQPDPAPLAEIAQWYLDLSQKFQFDIPPA